MLFIYGSGQQDNKSATTKNAGESLAISIAMAMRRYNTGCITQWSTSNASKEATGCLHWASARIALPRWLPWLTNKKLFLAS